MAAVERPAVTEASRRTKALALLAGRSGAPDRLTVTCEALACLLGYRWAGLALLVDEGAPEPPPERRIRLAAAWGEGPSSGAVFALSDLPGHQLHQERRSLYWPAGVGTLFPRLRDFSGYREESYRGHALEDAAGAVIGHLFALHHESDGPEARHADLLFLLACLAGLELERRQAVEVVAQLQRSVEETSRINRAKTEFLASMSHELRTPLNAIIGFSEVMEKELLGQLSPAVYRDYARDIRASGLHLLGIINDILDVAKAEAGKLELDREPLCLRALTEECLRLVRQRAEKAGIRLDARLPQRAPLVLADPLRMKQVLLNLLSNAIKFTPAGGSVRLSLKIGSKSGVLLEIVDSGIGMSAEEVTQALQHFTQLHSGLNRDREGTGLGLPLSSSLVELHGGRPALRPGRAPGRRARIWLPPRCILDRHPRRPPAAKEEEQ